MRYTAAMAAAALLLVLTLAGPAGAYYPHAGDRAADFYGRDIVSDSVVHLEDYLGKWVWVEFWAPNCGPCWRHLPEFIERTAPFRADGALEAVFVCNSTDYETIKKRVEQFDIDWPMLVFNRDEMVPKAEWHNRGNPMAYLVDPQGVIVGSGPGAQRIGDLLTLLEFYTAQPEPDPPLGLRCSWNLDSVPDVELILELSSPRREPLDIEIDYRYVDIVWDESGKVTEVNRIHPVEDGPELSFTVGFDHSCELSWPVTIDAQDYEAIEFAAAVRIPGSEHWRQGGIWVLQGGELVFEYPEYCRERAWPSLGPE